MGDSSTDSFYGPCFNTNYKTSKLVIMLHNIVQTPIETNMFTSFHEKKKIYIIFCYRKV